MKKFFCLTAMVASMILVSSCGGSPKDVYVAGLYTDTDTDIDVACYWKNGTKVDLGTGLPNDSIARSIYVVGSDVYAVGTYYDGSRDIASYWKNTTMVDLVDLGTGDSDANDIYVSDGGKVYIAGAYTSGADSIATLWTSATTKVDLGSAGVDSYAYTIYPNDGVTLYIAGTSDTKPTYWTYNTTTHAVVETVVSTDPGMAYGIAVSGSDIYLGGMLISGNPQAAYWKNGVIVELSSAPDFGQGMTIAVEGSDVYVTGTLSVGGASSPLAVYWKNGTPVNLSTLAATDLGTTTGVVISEGDVYISGFYMDSVTSPTYEIPAYWKNDTRVDLLPAGSKGIAWKVFVN